MTEQPSARTGRGVSDRLALAQRAAVAVVLAALASLVILHLCGIRLGLFASRWAGGSFGLAVILVALLSACFRHRQVPVISALVLIGAAAAIGSYSDYVLLVALLGVCFSSAGYLATQFIGFLLPVRWQPRVDAAAINVTLVLASISAMFVLAEILLWLLGPGLDSPSGKTSSARSALVPAILAEARAETMPTPPGNNETQIVSVRIPTLAEADALLEPAIAAAARRRAEALTMAPEWERREIEVPGARRAVYWQGALHVYNSDGFRMLGSPRPKDPSVFRALVLGDSLTYGHGIDERFTYSRQLERQLRRSWRVEVVNAGISGAQSEDVVRVARRLIPEMQADLVIYGVCLNDFLPSGVGEYDGSFHLPDLIRTRTRIGPIAELLVSNALIRLGVSKDFFDDILNGMPKYRARFARDVAELDHFVRAHEIPPVIALVLDQFPEIGGRGQHIAWLAEQALAAAGMTVLDTEAYYRQFSQMSPLRVSRWEGHPNEEVNAVWALMLEQVVEQDQRLAGFRNTSQTSSVGSK